jgi:hypothetical protein
MGQALRDMYGNQMVVMGFDFAHGSFNAVGVSSTGSYSSLGPHTVQTPPNYSYEDYFVSASMPRFVLPLFPAFWVMAETLERRSVPRWAVAAVGAAGLGLLVPLFVNWYYIF